MPFLLVVSVGAAGGMEGGGTGVEFGSEALSPEEVEGAGMAGVEADDEFEFELVLVFIEILREGSSFLGGENFWSCSGGRWKVTIFVFLATLSTRSFDEEGEADEGVDMVRRMVDGGEVSEDKIPEVTGICQFEGGVQSAESDKG
jgi:hypothetical protein